MTIICAAKRGAQYAIASDGRATSDSLIVTDKHFKLMTAGPNLMGFAGTTALVDAATRFFVKKECQNDPSWNSNEIRTTFNGFTRWLRGEYDIKLPTDLSDDELYLGVLVVNQNRIYMVDNCWSIHEFANYWAIGSGGQFAIGALDAMYTHCSDFPDSLVVEAVNVAMRHEVSCGGCVDLLTSD